jgi:uncharacterized membrane protein
MDGHDLALAYSLSSIAGLRASLTIAAVSLAVHLHWLAAPPGLMWIGSDVTLGIAAVFAVADFVADKVPGLDHVLHLVHMVLAPVAGGTVALTADPTLAGNGNAAIAVAAIAGANALGINGLRSSTRAASSATTMGMLNPVVSLVEDFVAAIALVAAFAVPIIVAVTVLLLTVIAVFIVRRVLGGRVRHVATSG